MAQFSASGWRSACHCHFPQNIGARIAKGKQNICRQEEDFLDMEIATIQENYLTWVSRRISEISAEISVPKSSIALLWSIISWI